MIVFPRRSMPRVLAGAMTAAACDASAFSNQRSSTAKVSEFGPDSSTAATRSIRRSPSPSSAAPAAAAKSASLRARSFTRPALPPRRRCGDRDVQRVLHVRGDVVTAVRRPLARHDEFVVTVRRDHFDRVLDVVGHFRLPALGLLVQLLQLLLLFPGRDLAR